MREFIGPALIRFYLCFQVFICLVVRHRVLSVIRLLFPAGNNSFEPVRFFLSFRVRRIIVRVIDELHQLLEILTGELIDRSIGELGKYMPDPVDEITFKTCVLFNNRHQRNQCDVAQGPNLPSLGLDCLCGLGGKLDQLLLDFIRCL